jgi:hypothetical protein
MDDFIGVYDNALTPEQCEHIIGRFNASKDVIRGKTGQGVDISKKDSYDLTISNHKEWNDVSNLMMAAVLKHLGSYVSQYRMLVMGALSPTLLHPGTGQPTVLSLDNFDDFDAEHISNVIRAMYRGGAINVQKYLQNSGGYHHWHSEVYPQNATCETLHRVLLFQFYLNHVQEGGSTEFFYQKRHVEARQGRLVIAPAGFTHSHKGHVSQSGDKYVATSWILFQRAETLYGK